MRLRTQSTTEASAAPFVRQAPPSITPPAPLQRLGGEFAAGTKLLGVGQVAPAALLLSSQRHRCLAFRFADDEALENEGRVPVIPINPNSRGILMSALRKWFERVWIAATQGLRQGSCRHQQVR